MRFRVFHSLVLAIIGTIAYKALLLSPDWARDPDYGVYVVPAVVGILWALFSSSRGISDFLLSRLAPVRRMLAGRSHIEGDWPLVVVDCRTGILFYYGFLNISFQEGQYVVSGHDWYPDGSHALNFHSVQTYPSHPTLHYWYRQGEGGRQRGYTFIEFFPTDEVPKRHTGVFHDKEHPDVRFYARRIEYKRGQRRIKGMEPRRQAAAAFAAELEPRLPQLIKTAVDTDWG